uniref:Uncharacterized protein n=1 Tax=Anguilla anguilla TaxID=7936 RepID=A0A0E9SGN1_ANGAN
MILVKIYAVKCINFNKEDILAVILNTLHI